MSDHKGIYQSFQTHSFVLQLNLVLQRVMSFLVKLVRARDGRARR